MVWVTGCETMPDAKTKSAAQWQQQHQEFRAGEGWRRTAYVNPEVVEKLTPETVSIAVHLDEQRGLLLYREKHVAMDFPISSGRRGFRTETGEYQVINKHRDHASNLYGNIVDVESGRVLKTNADVRRDEVPEGAKFVGSPMPYFLRLTNTGLGLHVGTLPGYAASHGCIRVPGSVMPQIFELSPRGTPVVIRESAPSMPTDA